MHNCLLLIRTAMSVVSFPMHVSLYSNSDWPKVNNKFLESFQKRFVSFKIQKTINWIIITQQMLCCWKHWRQTPQSPGRNIILIYMTIEFCVACIPLNPINPGKPGIPLEPGLPESPTSPSVPLGPVKKRRKQILNNKLKSQKFALSCTTLSYFQPYKSWSRKPCRYLLLKWIKTNHKWTEVLQIKQVVN